MPKRKSKVSTIKRSNQRQTKLSKQGKLKKKRNRRKDATGKQFKRRGRVSKPAPLTPEEQEIIKQEEAASVEHLKRNFESDAYSFLAKAHLKSEEKPSRRRKRKLENENAQNEIEFKYEQTTQVTETKRKKFLLPIKTREGIVPRAIEVEEVENEEAEEEENKEEVEEEEIEVPLQEVKEYTSADLLARRIRNLQQKKFRIGLLSLGLLENPEAKIANFKPLLEMLTENDPEVRITVRKLALMSLLEVFKDILPDYQIQTFNTNSKVKLKKDVKILRDYESQLLKHYKSYLQKIEGIISVLDSRKKKKVTTEPELNLALLGLKCLCDLLIQYPHFNFAKNIVYLLVPFLNSNMEKVRNIVSTAVKEIFRTDKRGELSLVIVRAINKFVKSKSNSVHPDVILVFLSLRLKDINLDKEKEEELQKKKLNAKKHKILKLSKRERKRKKRLEEVEKELLETKATENKEKKHEHMTEITKLIFMIYFKILKVTPNSKLLNAALEGLAKFAHCINVEYYHDLVNVLNHLIETENLGFKEKLCCVHTVFTILFYQGATIYLDPSRFYTHLYANMIYLNAGKSHVDIPLVLKAVDVVLLKRRKYVSLQRLLAFTKRLSLMTLQVLPNGALAFLNIIREILQVNHSTDILLDIDSTIGQGIYYPEMDEPEYCNAGVSSLWELLPLQRHYHVTVREYANIVVGITHTGEKSNQFKSFLKLDSEELFSQYDPSGVKFNPPVRIPEKFSKKKKRPGKTLMNSDLENYIKETLRDSNLYEEMMKI